MIDSSSEKTKKKKGGLLEWWRNLGHAKEIDLLQESRDLPPHDGFSGGGTSALNQILNSSNEDAFDFDEYQATEYQLPTNRIDKYHYFDVMARDSVIDTAIDNHLNNAFAPKTDTGQILRIDPVDNMDAKIAKELQDYLQPILNKNIRKWMYGACKNGVSYVLPYLEQGVGITSIRHDYYTRPDMIKEFEKGGNLLGFLHKTQIDNNKKGEISLLPPMRFVSFKMPASNTEIDEEPVWKDKLALDIASGSPEDELPIETQDYGRSMLEAAYGPYVSLKKAVRSLDAARAQAGRKERFIGVNTAGTLPAIAADYFSRIISIFKKKKSKWAERSAKTGSSFSVENTIIPSAGELTITTETSDVNIAHIEDVLFHVSRVAGALSIDKSLLGFTEELSGGLGDGGFFNVSLAASNKANSIRGVAIESINTLIELHVFYKYGKIYPDNAKPWKIIFNSMATAVEKEEQIAFDGRVATAMQELTLVQTMDPEWSLIDKATYMGRIFTDLLKIPENEFELLKAKPQPKKEAPADAPPSPPKAPPVFDSNTENNNVRRLVYETITELFGENDDE